MLLSVGAAVLGRDPQRSPSLCITMTYTHIRFWMNFCRHSSTPVPTMYRSTQGFKSNAFFHTSVLFQLSVDMFKPLYVLAD